MLRQTPGAGDVLCMRQELRCQPLNLIMHACFYCLVPLASPVTYTGWWSQYFGVDTSKAVYWDARFCKSAANLFEFVLFELNNSWIPGRHQEVPQVLSLQEKNCV